MPYDPQGNHSLPNGTIVQTGDKVLPSQHNPAMQDISASLSAVLKKDGRDGMVGVLNMGSFEITNVATSQTATSAATVGQLQSSSPIGSVIDFALKTLPAGWLWCDGSILLSTTQYTTLRNALIADGFPYGQDGSGNPKLPDCRGLVRAGRDDMGGTDAGRLSAFFGAVARTLGGVLGAASHILTAAQGPVHAHGAGTLIAPDHVHGLTLPARTQPSTGETDSVRVNLGSTNGAITTLSAATAGSGALGIGGSTANSTGGSAHPNAQPTIIMNAIIRATY